LQTQIFGRAASAALQGPQLRRRALPSSPRQFTVMVNSNFASSSIRQPNIAWPRPSTGPQVFAGLVRHRHRELGRFTSAILPKYMRRVPSVDALIPALYLKGISTGDFSEAYQ
jgi:hypothetical protein